MEVEGFIVDIVIYGVLVKVFVKVEWYEEGFKYFEYVV